MNQQHSSSQMSPIDDSNLDKQFNKQQSKGALDYRKINQKLKQQQQQSSNETLLTAASINSNNNNSGLPLLDVSNHQMNPNNKPTGTMSPKSSSLVGNNGRSSNNPPPFQSSTPPQQYATLPLNMSAIQQHQQKQQQQQQLSSPSSQSQLHQFAAYNAQYPLNFQHPAHNTSPLLQMTNPQFLAMQQGKQQQHSQSGSANQSQLPSLLLAPIMHQPIPIPPHHHLMAAQQPLSIQNQPGLGSSQTSPSVNLSNLKRYPFQPTYIFSAKCINSFMYSFKI